jgi:hypothetical protein
LFLKAKNIILSQDLFAQEILWPNSIPVLIIITSLYNLNDIYGNVTDGTYNRKNFVDGTYKRK